MKGQIESYSRKFHAGFITPKGGGESVLFTLNAVVGGREPISGESVDYDLYAQGPTPEAKRVVLG